MSDEALRIQQVVSPNSRTIAAAMRAAARAAGHKDSGKLIGGMKPKIRMDGEDVWGISIQMKRYGYILHNGVAAQTIKRGGVSFFTKGVKGSGFISQALEQTVPKLADDLQRVSGDLSVDKIRF